MIVMTNGLTLVKDPDETWDDEVPWDDGMGVLISKGKWLFCLDEVKKLWHLPKGKTTFWIEASNEPLTGAYKATLFRTMEVKLKGVGSYDKIWLHNDYFTMTKKIRSLIPDGEPKVTIWFRLLY